MPFFTFRNTEKQKQEKYVHRTEHWAGTVKKRRQKKKIPFTYSFLHSARAQELTPNNTRNCFHCGTDAVKVRAYLE